MSFMLSYVKFLCYHMLGYRSFMLYVISLLCYHVISLLCYYVISLLCYHMLNNIFMLAYVNVNVSKSLYFFDFTSRPYLQTFAVGFS